MHTHSIFRPSPVNGVKSKKRKSCFKVQYFGIAKEVVPLVAFGLVLATVDVYSDLALSYQFFSVNTTSLITKPRYQGVVPENISINDYYVGLHSHVSWKKCLNLWQL